MVDLFFNYGWVISRIFRSSVSLCHRFVLSLFLLKAPIQTMWLTGLKASTNLLFSLIDVLII